MRSSEVARVAGNISRPTVETKKSKVRRETRYVATLATAPEDAPATKDKFHGGGMRYRKLANELEALTPHELAMVKRRCLELIREREALEDVASGRGW